MRVDSELPVDFRSESSAVIRQPSRVMTEPCRTLSAHGASTLLGHAWQEVVGDAPAPDSVTLLTAQWSLETDAGRHMPGHNFGGIKAAPMAAGASLRTVEGYGARRREVTARFRLYDSAESGAHDYVRLLKNRYPAALEAARAGDVSGFAHALGRGGYFTADPRTYAHGLEQRFQALQHPDSHAASSSAEPAQFGVSEAALWGLLQALSREPGGA
jgi:hypothetical protein